MPSVQTVIDHLRLFRPSRLNAPNNEWPTLSATAALPIEAARLDAFHRVCPGWHDLEHLPPTYPQLAAAAVHLGLLGTHGFPFHPMGLVHVTNEIEQFRPIHRTEALTFTASVGPGGMHPKGRMIEVLTELKTANGEIPWTSRATALKMSTNQPRSKPQEPQEDRAGWRDSETIRCNLQEDLGRRYGKVAGDLNPIHQRAWLAKPFGFSRHIIHGTWTLAWALHPILSWKSSYKLEARFKRPVPLPSALHSTRRNTAKGHELRVWSTSLWKPALEINVAF